MKYWIAILGLIATGSVLADDHDKEGDDRKRNDCVSIKSYNRMFYQAMTDHYMFVRAGKDEYLVTFKRKCSNISDGYNIRFDTNSRRVCSNNRPKVAYLYRNIEMPSCRVESIEEVDDWREAQAIANQKEQVRRAAEKEKKEAREERKKAKKKS